MRKKFDDEILRYGAVIRDPSNPVSSLRVVTSTPLARDYLHGRISHLLDEGVPFTVVHQVVP